MRLSAEKCRAEQARQLELARTEPLANRRRIAANAAEAWGNEALRAEERKVEEDNPLSKEDAKIARQFSDEAAALKGNHAD